MLASLVHFLGVNTDLVGQVKSTIATPLLDAMEILIPGAVAISGIHKLMEHRDSAGGMLVELVTKGGGAILVLQIVKAMAGL